MEIAYYVLLTTGEDRDKAVALLRDRLPSALVVTPFFLKRAPEFIEVISSSRYPKQGGMYYEKRAALALAEIEVMEQILRKLGSRAVIVYASAGDGPPSRYEDVFNGSVYRDVELLKREANQP